MADGPRAKIFFFFLVEDPEKKERPSGDWVHHSFFSFFSLKRGG